MSKPILSQSNDLIIASGLHALYMPSLRESYDLGIYLDIDEQLRRHFKIRRDVNVRGHSLEKVLASFERREPDAAKFIRPQAHSASLIFSLQPIHPGTLQSHIEKNSPLRLKLVVKTKTNQNQPALIRTLVGICGLHVDFLQNAGSLATEYMIEGDTSAEDIELAAKILCPRIFEFLDINPIWKDGVTGLMQLITLTHIDQALVKRFAR